MSSEPDGLVNDHLRLMSRVMGLAIACPFSQDNPDHCQICAVRDMPMSDRVGWVRSLSTAELRQIAIDHDACMKAMMGAFERRGST